MDGQAKEIGAVSRKGVDLMYKMMEHPVQEKKKEIWVCNICGKVIETGNHVKITTKRRTKLHIHNECVGRGMAL